MKQVRTFAAFIFDELEKEVNVFIKTRTVKSILYQTAKNLCYAMVIYEEEK